ncbi:MAG: hypothetical protein QG552_2188 [Thermodesulfobacteriota bacterium]|nr:hypothetical protein [Thermodesulfobacteriota bacterium]
MNGQTEAKQSPLDISYLTAKYLMPILERKWLIIAFFISGSIVSFILSSFIKPEFYSIASLLVQEPRSKISSKTETNPMVPRTADETYVLSEAEALRSVPLVTEVLKILPEKVKEELDINLDPYQQIVNGLKSAAKKWLGLNWLTSSDTQEVGKSVPANPGDIDKERIGALQNRVIIKSKSKNAMLWITATSTNKYAAPIIVASYISVWMARNLEDNKRSIQVEKKFALEQRDTARNHLNEAAKKLMDFRNHYEIPTYVTPKEGLGDMELQSDFERLQGQVKGATERFEYLDQIVLKLQMEESGIAENIKLLDSPTSPGAPSKTLKPEILLIGILGGLGVGIGIVLGLDFLKSPIRHEKDITIAVDVPIFGHIPKI